MRPTAAILSLSTTARDPRVSRHCQALLDDGWSVVSVGFGSVEGHPHWTHHTIADLPFATRPDKRAMRAANLLAVRLAPSRARVIWGSEPRNQALRRATDRIQAADLVIANDATALPAGIDLAKRLRGGLIYDTHEYAAVERVEHASWRVLYPPYIRALEREGTSVGARWMTVSSNIASALSRDYNLAIAPVVIRNLPPYRAMPLRSVGEPMLVHYHGVLTAGRGLEALLDSVPLWRDGLRLRLRGPGTEIYMAGLRSRRSRLACDGRVEIAPGLPLQDLIPAANDADLGIHLLPPYGDQNRFALPNKLFEYIMAGIGVVTSNLPEMGNIVRRYNVGCSVPDLTPDTIANVLNGISPTQVAAWKANAIVAARQLCWEQERVAFQHACREASNQRLHL